MKKFLLFTFLLVTVYLHAEIRYVSKTGSNTPPFLNWETAADSIQKCINICNSGDTVYVGNGTYKEKIIMKAGISLIGSGMDSCIIDTREFPQDPQIIAVKWEDNCLLSGFSIFVSPSTGTQGYGVYSYNLVSGFFRGIILNNRFSYCRKGIICAESVFIIRNNIFTNLKYGVELYSNHSYEEIIENNYFNFTEIGVHQANGTKPIVRNNLFYCGNASSSGIGFAGFTFLDTVKFYNNIGISVNLQEFCSSGNVPSFIFNNTVIGKFYRGFTVSSNSKMINNIAAGGTIGFRYFQRPGSFPIIQYNNSWRNSLGYDNFSADSTNTYLDPMVVSEDSIKNFHLQMFSPMIDAGDPFIFDIDGTRSDIGAYGGPYGENYKYLDYPPRVPVILSAVNDSGKVRLSWKLNTETDFQSYILYRDTTPDFIADSTKLITELNDTTYTDTVLLSVKKVYYKIRSKDNQGNTSNSSKEVAIIISNVTGEKEISPILDYELFQNYPNPFNPGTIIPYRLKESGYVKLMVYDIKGELVSVLVNQEQEPGYYKAEFRAEHKTSCDWIEKIASGIYLYTLEIKNGSNIPIYNEMKKMILIK